MEARKAHSNIGIPTTAVGAWTVQGEEARSKEPDLAESQLQRSFGSRGSRRPD